MSVRRLLAAAAAGLLGVLGLAAPAAAHMLVQPADVSAYTMTAGRFWSLVAVLLGLAGVLIGGVTLARSPRTGGGRRGAIMALLAGLTCTIIGGLVVAAANGGPGTGYGIVGGFLDLVIGAIAMVLGGLALARSRRNVS
ncbi:hypothetical protein GCM10011608_45480 [Micromonospora sonchi]|uniref:Uncharacterized protein n=1 Tax=Micromonospora sonchi TaxID=1763543 RepID=A0A917U3P2_9ACTN|nr:DUF6223 family protein [Micromonospora sonchi]GGM55524.1 hypothetical protein GCM10011608_45480 [Micromonospora sonchi]